MGLKDNDGLNDGPGVSPFGIGFNLEGLDGFSDGEIDREGTALIDGRVLGLVDTDGSSVGVIDREGIALIEGGLLIDGSMLIEGLKDVLG